MITNVTTKVCSHCRWEKSLDDFGVDHSRLDGLKYQCRDCVREIARKSYGSVAHDENKSCSQYLGIHVAEPLLLNYYKSAIKMPMHNKGYDYLCGKGFKIDVKSACIVTRPGCKYWYFNTAYNEIADYFLCIAFDDRTNLTVLHTWLIPGMYGADKRGIQIGCGKIALAKWKDCEVKS